VAPDPSSERGRELPVDHKARHRVELLRRLARVHVAGGDDRRQAGDDHGKDETADKL